ncbi:flagellin [Selenomonas sp. AE3005]|uniref:flagellin N-terminal helical domain-containing protein n=1 Tax=Selenomonas sp. AE3005 TaxID=1485543 RepID=UPI0025CD37AE|nr:flagellin [Selenomonas sp. AE3005]
MAMTIMNNAATAMTLGELNKNISRVGKQLKKVSSGMRINSAGDDASGYAISEKMRVRIRGLEQDERNVQNGSSLISVAAGGIESIIEELRNLKELSLNAANDTNTDLDRATLQKEFDHRRANIDNIALETNYNGKILLDGTYGRKSTDIEITSTGTDTPGETITTNILQPTDPSKVGPTNTVIHSGAVEPTEIRDTINDHYYTVGQSGVYALDSGASKIVIANGVHDVKFVQASGATLTNIHITGPSDGNTNLWIEDLTLTNSDNTSFIKFQGANNTMNFKGTNTLNFNQSNIVYGDLHAVIHVGGGLTIEGGADGSGSLIFNHQTTISGALIGSNGNHGIGGSPDDLSSPITVNSGNYTSNMTGLAIRYGAFIGSGSLSGIGNITVNGGTFVDNGAMDGGSDVTIGSGSGWNNYQAQTQGFRGAYCGDIVIKNATITAAGRGGDPCIGSGADNSTCGNIYVGNSQIEITPAANTATSSVPAIGSSYEGKWDSNITVENSIISVTSKTGAGIGTGENGRVGDITINNCDLTQVVSKQGEYVGRGVNGQCGVVTINGVQIDPNSPGNQPGGDGTVEGTETTSSTIPGEKTIITKVIGNPLVIHHGTKSNEAINVFINDMRTTALKGKITDDTGAFVDPMDLDHLRNLSHNPKAYQAYVDLLHEADGKTLNDVSLTTQHGASVAIRVIDGALEYALSEATTMGAYLSRLEHTANNIVTANETTVASESTIRDANMAKEMAEYTKANVLSQASQSMLAQANQTSASALGLLQ